MMSTEDRTYLEGKFSGIYEKIDDNQKCILEKLDSQRKETGDSIKEEIIQHSDNPCKNIVTHEKDKHEGMMLKVLVLIGAVIATIFAVSELVGRLGK